MLVKQERRDAEKSGAEKERQAVEMGGRPSWRLPECWVNSLAGTDKERQSCDRRIKAPVLKDEFINRLQEIRKKERWQESELCEATAEIKG